MGISGRGLTSSVVSSVVSSEVELSSLESVFVGTLTLEFVVDLFVSLESSVKSSERVSAGTIVSLKIGIIRLDVSILVGSL